MFFSVEMSKWIVTFTQLIAKCTIIAQKNGVHDNISIKKSETVNITHKNWISISMYPA